MPGQGPRSRVDGQQDRSDRPVGKYLAEELPAIYGERAGAVVVFISAEYVARD